MKLTLTHKTVQKIIDTLRDGADAAERCADFFFDDGEGPHDDLMKSAADCERLAMQLEAKLNPIEA